MWGTAATEQRWKVVWNNRGMIPKRSISFRLLAHDRLPMRQRLAKFIPYVDKIPLH